MDYNAENSKETLRKKMILSFVNRSNNEDPKYFHFGDSGFDLRAWITKDDDNAKYDENEKKYYIELLPLERQLVHTGIYFNMIPNTEIQVRPRSGYALKKGLSVCNTPGTIDENYTGEAGIISINLSNDVIRIYSGDRIAQAVVMPVLNSKTITLKSTDKIEDNKYRGEKGYASSGF